MFAFLQAAHAVEERIEQALASVGLSMAKYGPLMLLARAGEPLVLSELASGLRCVRSNMTKLMDRLEAEGLVRRIDDPADRRVTRALLTPLGRERQEAAARELERLEAAFAALLSPEERTLLQRLLARLG
jgi:DNA-binding MarR family transcriptional regulator